MSQYNEYNQAEKQPQTNNKPSNSGNKKLYYIIASILGIVVLIGALAFFFQSPESSDASSSDSANNSLSSSQDEQADNDQNSDNSQEEKSTPNGQAVGTVSDEEIEAQREEVKEFVKKGINFNPEEVTNGVFTVEQVQSIREEFKDDAVSIRVDGGKQVKVNVEYTSIGDQNFNEASLYIKFSEGITLVEDSMEDNFNDSEVIGVSPTVFNESDKLIIYGPGTGDQVSSQLNVGESGIFSFIVNIEEDAPDFLGVASYIKEENGKIGQPSVFFIDINR